MPQLAPIQLKRYNEDLLFFLYYSNGGELLQLLATIELWVCYLVNASVTWYSSNVTLRLWAFTLEYDYCTQTVLLLSCSNRKYKSSNIKTDNYLVSQSFTSGFIIGPWTRIYTRCDKDFHWGGCLNFDSTTCTCAKHEICHWWHQRAHILREVVWISF